jgi:hypothetical protein
MSLLFCNLFRILCQCDKYVCLFFERIQTLILGSALYYFLCFNHTGRFRKPDEKRVNTSGVLSPLRQASGDDGEPANDHVTRATPIELKAQSRQVRLQGRAAL